jgi:hypothetical protein
MTTTTAAHRGTPWRTSQPTNETGRDEERQADEDEHGPSVDEQLDQAVGDRDPEGGVQPDHERRTPVDRTSELAQAAGLLRDLGRLLHGLLDRFISGAAACPGFFVLGADFLLRPDLSRLRSLTGLVHPARLPVAGPFKPGGADCLRGRSA